MSITGILDRLWRLAPYQRMLSTAVVAATVAGAAGPHYGAIDLIVRVAFWFAIASLIELTLEAIRGAPLDRRAILAYLPLAFASLAFLDARTTAAHAARSGSLNAFFAAAASLLGLLLVSVVIEARRVGARDQWLRALRGWWVAFIIIGIVYALAGLTPGESQESLKSHYALVWASLVGAVAALAAVMWRDPAEQPGALPSGQDIASHQGRTPANRLPTSTSSTSNRTSRVPTEHHVG
jgi:hypothetical protein